MQKRLFLSVAIPILLILTGCVRTDRQPLLSPRTGIPELAILVSSTDGVWNQQTIQGFLDTCGKLGARSRVLSSTFDSSITLLNLNLVVEQGTDGVAIMSPPPEYGWALMSRAFSAGIPVVSIDERLLDSQRRQLAPYFGVDNTASGIRLANAFVEEMQDLHWFDAPDISAGIAVLTYDGFVGMKRRTDAFSQRIGTLLPEGSEVPLFSIPCLNGSAVNGLLAVQQLLAAHPEITHWAIFGATAESALGAVRGLEQLGLGEVAIVGGIDTSDKKATPPLQSRTIMLTVDTYAQGAAAATALYRNVVEHVPIESENYPEMQEAER